jgi:hypothetical protein
LTMRLSQLLVWSLDQIQRHKLSAIQIYRRISSEFFHRFLFIWNFSDSESQLIIYLLLLFHELLKYQAFSNQKLVDIHFRIKAFKFNLKMSRHIKSLFSKLYCC